jgi:hypothetical protein
MKRGGGRRTTSALSIEPVAAVAALAGIGQDFLGAVRTNLTFICPFQFYQAIDGFSASCRRMNPRAPSCLGSILSERPFGW